MTAEELIERVNALSANERESVLQFIDYLEHRQPPAKSAFLTAADQFIAEHSDLLARLAQ